VFKQSSYRALKSLPVAPSADADGARGILFWGYVTAILPRYAIRLDGTQTSARRGAMLLHIRIRGSNFLRHDVLSHRSAVAFAGGPSRQFLSRPFFERTLVIRRRNLMWITYPLGQVIVLPGILQNRFQTLAGVQLLLLLVRLPSLSDNLLHVSDFKWSHTDICSLIYRLRQAMLFPVIVRIMRELVERDLIVCSYLRIRSRFSCSISKNVNIDFSRIK